MNTTTHTVQGNAGFTLFELIIVVAIIAILALIADPCSLDSPTRARVSRAHSDMRSLATALEAYATDHGAYPSHEPLRNHVKQPDGKAGRRLRKAEGWNLSTVGPELEVFLHSLTAPLPYTTPLAFDPFFKSEEVPFAYFRDGTGWILFSPGPDRIYNLVPGTDYDSSLEGIGERLFHKTYDSTNGTKSAGDVWRIRGQ
jgi:prepilin-type N-terminal cleavage/methylation domain-containing protein